MLIFLRGCLCVQHFLSYNNNQEPKLMKKREITKATL